MFYYLSKSPMLVKQRYYLPVRSLFSKKPYLLIDNRRLSRKQCHRKDFEKAFSGRPDILATGVDGCFSKQTK